jgi:hypothetical protein
MSIRGRVLFVCEHGAAKRVIAAAHLNRQYQFMTSMMAFALIWLNRLSSVEP